MSFVRNEDLPEMMKARQKCAHKIAKEVSSQIWDHASRILRSSDKQISGNEALTYYGTIISSIAARWIINMDKIAKSDDAGILTEDLVKDTLNGIAAMMGGEIDFEEEKPLPNGIKRLNKV